MATTTEDQPVRLDIILSTERRPTLLSVASRFHDLGVLVDVMSWDETVYQVLLYTNAPEKIRDFLEIEGYPEHRLYSPTVRSVSYTSPFNVVLDLNNVLYTAPAATVAISAAARSILKLVDKVTDTRKEFALGRVTILEARIEAEKLVRALLHEKAESAKGSELTPEEITRFDHVTAGRAGDASRTLIGIERVGITNDTQETSEGQH